MIVALLDIVDGLSQFELLSWGHKPLLPLQVVSHLQVEGAC